MCVFLVLGRGAGSQALKPLTQKVFFQVTGRNRVCWWLRAKDCAQFGLFQMFSTWRQLYILQ